MMAMTYDSDEYLEFIKARKAQIESLVADAAEKSGRSASEIEIVAVSKTVPVEAVLAAHEAGYRVFGENRPQELTHKLACLSETPFASEISFDMIGNLQKNKINQVVGKVRYIHSISSEHLAEAVSKRAEVKGTEESVLLEVNVSAEASKSGFSPEEVSGSIQKIVELPHISVVGLMTMAPKDDQERAKRTFSGLRELRDRLSQQVGLKLDVLSCGMSDDFTYAIEEGSTTIRLGRVLFDPAYTLSGH